MGFAVECLPLTTLQAGGRTPGLKKLTERLLGMLKCILGSPLFIHGIVDVKVQDGEHSSVEDARAAMAIYQRYAREWERSIRDKKADKIRSKSKEE